MENTVQIEQMEGNETYEAETNDEPFEILDRKSS